MCKQNTASPCYRLHTTPCKTNVCDSAGCPMPGGGEGRGRGSQTDFRSLGVNGKGSQVSPQNVHPQGRMPWTPPELGCVMRGMKRIWMKGKLVAHIVQGPGAWLPLWIHGVNRGFFRSEPLVQDCIYGSHRYWEPVMGTEETGALARGRDCCLRARGVEAAGNEGHAPLEMKGTW